MVNREYVTKIVAAYVQRNEIADDQDPFGRNFAQEIYNPIQFHCLQAIFINCVCSKEKFLLGLTVC